MLSFIQPIGRWRHIYLTCIVVFCMTVLVACGGGSGGSSGTDSDGTDNGATDSGGSSDNTAPTAAITGPLDGDAYTYGDTIAFTGSGTDAEDGELSGESLVWTSDLDDTVGTGASFTLNDLSWGDHTITLTATDSSDAVGSDEIFISIKAWTHPTGLPDSISPDGEEASYPRVAMDGNGNAVITWSQYDENTFLQIYKSEYRNGAWTHPTGLSDNISPDGTNADRPHAAMDNSGNAIITWHQPYSGYAAIFKSEYRNGAWTHPADLSDNISPDGMGASSPQVAMDDSGNAVIAWCQSDGTNLQIFKSEYRNGEWDHPDDTSDSISPDGQHAWGPMVAMDNSGNAIITWYQLNDDTVRQIFKSEFRNGAWTHPTGLSDNISPDGQPAYNPTVAMDDNGNAIIAWRQPYDGYSAIFKSEYRNGAWTHPTDLSDNISPDGGIASAPSAAMGGNGNAVITWHQSYGSNYQIFKSESRNGEWDHPDDLSDNISPDGYAEDIVRVAMDDNGNAVITWYQNDGSSIFQIFKSEYRNGAWTHPTDLSDNISADGQYMGLPDVGMDENGNAVITWEGYDGSYDQIFMSEYY